MKNSSSLFSPQSSLPDTWIVATNSRSAPHIDLSVLRAQRSSFKLLRPLQPLLPHTRRGRGGGVTKMIDWWCYNSVTPPHRVIQCHPQPIIHSPHNTVMTTDCTSLSSLSLVWRISCLAQRLVSGDSLTGGIFWVWTELTLLLRVILNLDYWSW